jgi:hypothetical protein
MDECKELPGIYRPSLGFELGLERIGERQIHVVAAQKNVFSDADTFELQRAIVVGNGNQAKIGGSAADITDQDNVTRTDQGAPLPTCLRDPGVCMRRAATNSGSIVLQKSPTRRSCGGTTLARIPAFVLNSTHEARHLRMHPRSSIDPLILPVTLARLTPSIS